MPERFGGLGPLGGDPSFGRRETRPVPVPTPDNPGFGASLERVLPFILSALVGAKNPSAGGAFAQGVLERRQQDDLTNIRQQSVDVDREIVNLRRDEIAQRQQAARAAEAAAERERIAEEAERRREVVSSALAEENPEIARLLFQLNGLPLPENINQILDDKQTQRMRDLAGTQVNELKEQYDKNYLITAANEGQTVTASPSLLRHLRRVAPEIAPENGRIPLKTLMVQSGRFLIGDDGLLHEVGPESSEEAFYEDYATQRGFTRFEDMSGTERGQAERAWKDLLRSPSFDLKEATVNGRPGLVRINTATGQVEPVDLPAGVSLVEEGVSQIVPFIDQIDALSQRINDVNVTTDPDTGQQREGIFNLVARGVAEKLRGRGQRLAGALNANTDVALYTGMVSAFTPMLARALGHTGVLTELDVRSAMRILPMPGESVEIRDAKIDTLRRLSGVASELFSDRAPSTDENNQFQARLAEAQAAAVDVGDAGSQSRDRISEIDRILGVEPQ